MPISPVSPGADVVRIEIVFGGVSSEPSHGSLAIFDLRRKRCNAAKTIVNARDGVAIIHESNSRSALFSAPAPASAMNPNDHRQGTGKFLGRIKVEREYFAVDALVDQISLGRGIGHLSRAPPRHDRLRYLPTQNNRGECNREARIPLSHEPKHWIFRRHIADAILLSKNRPVAKLDWQRFFNFPGLGMARKVANPSLIAPSFLQSLSANSFFPNS